VRFVRLVVEAFQAIQRAEIEFGPGLNVIYGPNDLGKSTLATAIRAALLVPPTSSEADNFGSWYADATPRVSLTFVDDTGSDWKVSKGFGGGAHTGAELLYAKDGTSFALDCKARQVEEKIRGLLAWGIPTPGGKSGPRGVPSSFLANALLAAQTDVDAILGASIANDPGPSGKLRLSNALATLAQDPLFKKVLDAAQQEVDQYFTRTGQRSRAQTSRFTEANNLVKGLEKERDVLLRQVTDSAAIEDRVKALHERRTRALMCATGATGALAAMRERVARTRVRIEAKERLSAAKAALEELDQFAKRVNAVEAVVDTLSLRAKSRQADVARALAECEAANLAVRMAEENHRLATSEDGVRQRELAGARLAEQAAALSSKRQGLQTRKATLDAAVRGRDDAKMAQNAAIASRALLEKLSREIDDSRERAEAVAKDLELARATLAYGRWCVAASAADDATKAKAAAIQSRIEAEQKEAEATTLEGRAGALDEDLAQRRARLPSDEVANTLTDLARQLEVAEAGLGGGLSVTVRPRAAIALQALVDQKEAVTEPNLMTERVLDGERHVRLSLGDIVEIEVTAGTPDKRRALEHLQMRSRTELAPVLQQAGLKSLRDVASQLLAISQERTVVAEIRKDVAQLRTDANTLRDHAAMYEEQATRLDVNIDDLEVRRAAIGATGPQVLETLFAGLGKAWESQSETTHTKKSNELNAARVKVTMTEQEGKVAEYRVSEADRRAAETAAAYDAALSALQTSDPDGLLRVTEEELASLSQRDTEIAAALRALAAEETNAIQTTKDAVTVAEERTKASEEVKVRSAAALDEVKAELNGRIGERNALRAQLEALDRPSAEVLAYQIGQELAALPSEAPAVDADLATAEQEVLEANRELDEAKEELHKNEGALSKVGGAAIREEVVRIQEALAAATIREKELEIDADAWKLLRDTLRDVENEEGAHLGRALSGPVTTKFVELTGARYRDLLLDANLKTESVGVSATALGDSDVLAALSVGTRGQLATLIRLTIAEQLKSSIVLDDHLVNTDPKRLAWFREVLTKTALSTQVIVLTCRPGDYLSTSEIADGAPVHDVAGGTIRAINASRLVRRYDGASSRPSQGVTGESSVKVEG